MGQLRSIQVLRGLAACSVVAFHALYFAGVTGYMVGAAGVDLFFVISGFIMAMIPKRSSFLFDRFWRIYPLWWIAVLPWVIWAHPDWPTLADSLTLWPVYRGMSEPALQVGWTLSFEMLFYFALALSMRIGVKPVLALFAFMLAGAAVIRAPLFNFLGNPILFEFLLGVAIAKLPKDKRLAAPFLIVAVIILAISPAWVESMDVTFRIASAWRVLYWGIPAALIVYSCLSLERLFAHRLWNFPVTLGDASYSIYLFHLGVVSSIALWWPARTVLAIAAGLFVWRFVERSILSYRPAFLRSKPIAAAPAS